MRFEFPLPDPGEGMTEAEVLRWLVPLGADVAKDQPVVELQTDKASIEIPSPVAGTMLAYGGQEGDVLRVGSVLFALSTADPSPAAAHATPAVAAAAALAPAGDIPRAAPAVRRRARELGLDLRQVPGTGPGGRVVLADLSAAQRPATAAPPSPVPVPAAAIAAPPPGEATPLRGIRRTIAERMEQAARVPAFTILDEADVTELVELRQRHAARGEKLSFLPFVLKAAVLAMQSYPGLNGHFNEQQRAFVRRDDYHFGIATATENGLLVPVLRHVDRKSLLDLAAEVAAMAAGARAQKLSREELTGSTFSISNFGALGAMSGTPMLNIPEVAILGTGRVDRLPRFGAGGQVEARHIMHLALTVDHRVIDGDTAAGFLGALKAYIQEPSALLLRLR